MVTIHEFHNKHHYLSFTLYIHGCIFINAMFLTHLDSSCPGYMGHLLTSSAVATASQRRVEGTVRVLCSYCIQDSSCHSSIRVPSWYPGGTPICRLISFICQKITFFMPILHPMTLFFTRVHTQ